MKIRIKEADERQAQMWFNDFVGDEFEVLEVLEGIPKQYKVDVSELVKRGRMAESSRGIAYVPDAFAEVLPA